MPVVADPEPRRTRGRAWLWLLAVPGLLVLAVVSFLASAAMRPVWTESGGMVVWVSGRYCSAAPAGGQSPGLFEDEAIVIPNGATLPLSGVVYVSDGGTCHYTSVHLGSRWYFVQWFRGHPVQ